MEIRVGCVAMCRRHRIGIITHKKTNDEDKVTWHGIGFDGKPWQSKDPTWIADNVQEVIDNLRKYKYGG